MHDAIAIALKLGAVWRRQLGVTAAATALRVAGVTREGHACSREGPCNALTRSNA